MLLPGDCQRRDSKLRRPLSELGVTLSLGRRAIDLREAHAPSCANLKDSDFSRTNEGGNRKGSQFGFRSNAFTKTATDSRLRSLESQPASLMQRDIASSAASRKSCIADRARSTGRNYP